VALDDKPDFYEVLGVTAGASQAQIKKAYLRLANLHHPDKNPKNARAREQFLELQEAYQVLGDPALRARYDYVIESGQKGVSKSRSVIEAFFKNLRAEAGPWPRRGQDTCYTLELNLGDAARGGKFHIDVRDGDKLEVSVPPGIQDGTCLRLAGFGDPGTGGGRPGDMLVLVRIRSA
jgi:DnaJ-class molecular chaperone